MKRYLLNISIILITLIILISNPLVVKAGYNGGEGENGVDVSGKLLGGGSSAKTGIQMYIVDKETGVPLVSNAGMIFRDSSFTACQYKFLQSKLGNLGWGRCYIDPELPYPVTWSGDGWAPNGNSVKGWLLDQGSTMQRYEYLIKMLYGEATLTEIQQNKSKYSLVVEPIAWLHVYFGDKGYYLPSLSPLIGTADGWAKFYNNIEQPNGDAYTWKMTHAALPYSMVLETPRFGLGAHAGEAVTRLDGSAIRSSGYGIHIIDLEDELISTWDSVNYPDSPGPAPEKPSGAKANIIKNYYTADSDGNFISDDGCYSRMDVVKKISIDNEKNYKVVGWKISTTTKNSLSSNPSVWGGQVPSNVTRSGNSSQLVELTGIETAVYVLLERTELMEEETPDTNYILTESSLTRRVWLSLPDAQLSMPKITDFEFNWVIDAHETECVGHNYTDNCTDTDSEDDEDDEGDHCGGHTEYCSSFDWYDKKLMLSIHNSLENDYPDILATKDAWRFETKSGDIVKGYYDDGSFDRQSTEAQSYKENNWDYVNVIMRGKDKVTVAEWKNSSATNNELRDASSSGFYVANTPQGVRKVTDYIDTFSTEFVNEEEGTDLNTKYGAKTAASYTGKICTTETWAELANPLSIANITVKVEVYSGDETAGVNDKSCNTSSMIDIPATGFNTSSGRMVSTGEISFYPYLENKYDTLIETDKQVYILGQYKRAFTLNSYSEINWNQTSNNNLSLISSQWSTHAQPVKDRGADNVLNGGSTLGLSIKKDNRQTVELVTYQPVVKDELKTQIEKTQGSDGGLTESLAIADHKAYVESVVAGLENTVVQQYVDKNPDKTNAFNGILVNPDIDISALKNGASKSSIEDKYYFRTNEEGVESNQGDYDVNVGNTSTEYITISSDSAGNILFNGQVCLTKTQSWEQLTGEAKRFDDKTYAIRKFVMGIERNSGNDASNTWTDSAWYNEIVDPLYYIVQRTKLEVGFIKPSERYNVLDPKLIPYTKNKGDMYTNYFISQFKTRNHSEIYQTEYVMGYFKNKSVQMKNLDMFYWSRPFWIANNTTQNLQ